MVLPWTSLEAIEHRHRPSANAASPTRITTPATRPSPSAAVPAITPAEAACTRAPEMNTHLRNRTRTMSGVRNACGSIESDSRIGTSRPVSATGTPRALNIHGSTVEALTI